MSLQRSNYYQFTQSLIKDSLTYNSLYRTFDLIPLILSSRTTLKAFVDLLSNEAFLKTLNEDYLNGLIILARQMFKYNLVLNCYQDPYSSKVEEFNIILTENDLNKRSSALSYFAYTSKGDISFSEQINIPPTLKAMFSHLSPTFGSKVERKELSRVTVDNPLPHTGSARLVFRGQLGLENKAISENLFCYGAPARHYRYLSPFQNNILNGGLIPGGASGVLHALIYTIAEENPSKLIILTSKAIQEKFTHHEKHWPTQCLTIHVDPDNLLADLHKYKNSKIIVMLDETASAPQLKKLGEKLPQDKGLLVQYFSDSKKANYDINIRYAMITTKTNLAKSDCAGFIKTYPAMQELLRFKIKHSSWDISIYLPHVLHAKQEEKSEHNQCAEVKGSLPGEEPCVTNFFRTITQDESIHSIAMPGGSTGVIDLLMTQVPNSLLLTTTPIYGALLNFSCALLTIQLKKEHQYKLTPELFEKFLLEKKQQIGNKFVQFLLCNPGNPVGVSYTTTELTALYKVLAKYFPAHRFIIDIAHYDIHPTKKHAKVGVITGDNIVTVYSLSKTYGMAGARIGYVAGSSAHLENIINALPLKQTSAYLNVISHTIFHNDAKRYQLLERNNTAYRSTLDLLKVLVNGEKNANLSPKRLAEIVTYYCDGYLLYKHQINFDLLRKGLPGVEAEFPEAGMMVLLRFPGWKDKQFKYQTKTTAFIGKENSITIKTGGDLALIFSLYHKFVLPGEVCIVDDECPSIRITLTPTSPAGLGSDSLLLRTFMDFHEIAKKIGATDRKVSLGAEVKADDDSPRPTLKR